MHHPFCPREYLLRVCRLGTHHPFHAGHSCTPCCPPLNVGGVEEAATAVITLWFSSLDSLKLIQKFHCLLFLTIAEGGDVPSSPFFLVLSSSQCLILLVWEAWSFLCQPGWERLQPYHVS